MWQHSSKTVVAVDSTTCILQQVTTTCCGFQSSRHTVNSSQT